jgi:hypothetical protein
LVTLTYEKYLPLSAAHPNDIGRRNKAVTLNAMKINL